ncbi:MAG: hypothetical protein ACD_77C00472G0002 [uncultured bacterium]|nr:MAG: hypothetical protein ACD_77C00472G0002 [uncultured bacterium]
MKKSIYSLIILGFIISSCGTSNQYASSQYDDAIYNITSDRVIALNTATDESLRSLVKKTQEAEKAIVNGREAKIVYVNEKGVADIIVENENTYLILDSTMSYEERLRKFDSPDYNINIYISDRWGWDSGRYYDPFWYMSRNPFAFRHMAFGSRPYYRSSFFYDWWSSPYYGWYGGYYDPWNFGYAGYYNPYYWNSRYYGNYGGYYGYYNGYYGHGNHGWYDNWYSGGGGSSGGNNNSGQARYNGKRVANYRTDGDNNNPGPSRSVVKRNPPIEQIGGTRVTPTQNREGSVYRRDNKTGSSGVRYNNDIVTPTRDNRSSGQTERTGTTYRRNDGNERGTISSTSRTSSERGNTSASQSGSTYRKSSNPGSSYSRESGSGSGNASRNSSTTSSSRSTSSYVRSSSGGSNISSGTTSSRSSGSTSSSSSGSSSSSSSSSGSSYRR